jgi:glycosyltransferase involved in cell wall biosynthesis
MARILALNPFHGGSHRAFLDGWRESSRHQFDVLTLPAYKWKWRMRHGAITFAEQLGADPRSQDWELVWSTDMLNLAEFRGLAADALGRLPFVMYFHENQLTYPVRQSEERDLHFAFTNLVSALSAERVWFNSEFHRDEFLSAIAAWMERMPDFRPTRVADQIEQKSEILYPGFEPIKVRPPHPARPLSIAWVARWEHDKGPETFFQALRLLRQNGIAFRLRMMGESFADRPSCFDEARREFEAQIDQWGFVESRARYSELLASAHVVVSTADHEFFGIGVVEAVAHGCWPLVPARLAYPEVLGNDTRLFHDGTPTHLAHRLQQMARQVETVGRLAELPASLVDRVQQYGWPQASRPLDDAVERILK